MRKLNTKKIKKAVGFFGAAAVLPIIYIISVCTIKLFYPVIEKAAVFSAFVSFTPKNGDAFFILQNKGTADMHFIENSLEDYMNSDISDITDITGEWDEPPIVDTIDTQSHLQSDEVKEDIKPANAGLIERKLYTAGSNAVYINLKEGYIKNCTAIAPAKISETIKNPPKFKIKADNTPEVLIMHTHATESYQDNVSDYFDKTYTCRTTDLARNVTRVGDEIQKQLTQVGIGVIHDKTLHDYPSYNGSYGRSEKTVRRILKENPSIKVVLDVHRDAIQPSADKMIAPFTTIDGKRCAQVMIISGCDDGTMNMPKYMENLKFSAALQRQMEADYKTLARPVMFDYRKYNQNLTTGSILLEMGGHANTLDEAIYCGELVGKSLAKTLLKLK